MPCPIRRTSHSTSSKRSILRFEAVCGRAISSSAARTSVKARAVSRRRWGSSVSGSVALWRSASRGHSFAWRSISACIRSSAQALMQSPRKATWRTSIPRPARSVSARIGFTPRHCRTSFGRSSTAAELSLGSKQRAHGVLKSGTGQVRIGDADATRHGMRLKGKTAIVAGAGRNIGKAIALTYAREGADVILVAREMRAALDETAHECASLGIEALPVLADVGDPAQVEMVVRRGLDHFGKVDVLVAAAALRPHKPFWEISHEEWNQVLAVNLHSTFYFAKALAPGMIQRGAGGSIVALGGLASMTGQPQRAHVVASKTGLYGLIKALALELGPYGVRANLIAVGHIDTARRNPEWYPEGGGVPYMGEGGAGSDGSALGTADGSTPLRRLGSPQEVANVALFLASDEASYVTGDRIICAGGRYM